MTLIEAIKSGKAFRRKSCSDTRWIAASHNDYCLRCEAILADDWEIDEPKVTVTRGQVHAALEAAEKSYRADEKDGWYSTFCRALGFEE